MIDNDNTKRFPHELNHDFESVADIEYGLKTRGAGIVIQRTPGYSDGYLKRKIEESRENDNSEDFSLEHQWFMQPGSAYRATAGTDVVALDSVPRTEVMQKRILEKARNSGSCHWSELRPGIHDPHSDTCDVLEEGMYTLRDSSYTHVHKHKPKDSKQRSLERNIKKGKDRAKRKLAKISKQKNRR